MAIGPHEFLDHVSERTGQSVESYSGWHRIQDKPPESVRVLLSYWAMDGIPGEKKVTIGTLCGGQWCGAGWDGPEWEFDFREADLTHWAFLPSHPGGVYDPT